MKNKLFDCVEMKHKGADKIQNRLNQLTRQQELDYWMKGTEDLIKLQRSVIKKETTIIKK
jgi:hypothetical protein